MSAALVTGSVVLSLVACGSDEPPPRIDSRATFAPNAYGERVFEAYREIGDSTKIVTLPKGSREVGITLDCAGVQGRLEVNLSTAGGAGIDCSPTSSGRPGFVSLSGDGSLLEQEQEITITAPGDQRWSVAVDAGAKVTSNQEPIWRVFDGC